MERKSGFFYREVKFHPFLRKTQAIGIMNKGGTGSEVVSEEEELAGNSNLA